MLEGEKATEAAVGANLAGRRVVHLALHGLADEKFGNLFGALALTPPSAGKADAAPENDGFLSLHEIYTLPLGECDLAVLSACETNVGPQLPLEAGVTLATRLSAPSPRHVLASHWHVEDRSTAEMMSVFFKEAMAKAPENRPLPYALALQCRRQAIRGREEWAAPFYWVAVRAHWRAAMQTTGNGRPPSLWPAFGLAAKKPCLKVTSPSRSARMGTASSGDTCCSPSASPPCSPSPR